MSRRERIDVALVGFERVGLEPMIGDAAVVWLERLEDVRAVVTSVPPLVVFAAAEPQRRAAVDALRQELGARLPLQVVAQVGAGQEQVLAFSWQANTRQFSCQVAPLEELSPTIERMVGELRRRRSAALKRLGFNDHVERAAGALHVQTEVVGREVFNARTTVSSGGAILDVLAEEIPASVADDLDDAERHIARQHAGLVEQARRGHYD